MGFRWFHVCSGWTLRSQTSWTLKLSYWSWMLESFFNATSPWRTLIPEGSSEKIFELLKSIRTQFLQNTESYWRSTWRPRPHNRLSVSSRDWNRQTFWKADFPAFFHFPMFSSFFPNLLIKCVKSFEKKSKWLKLNTEELYEEPAQVCWRAVEVIVWEITSPTIWKDKYNCVVHRRNRLKAFCEVLLITF